MEPVRHENERPRGLAANRVKDSLRWRLIVRIAFAPRPFNNRPMSATDTEPRIEPATIEDLPQLVELLVALFSEEEGDFKPDRSKQEHGLRLILEQPNRGRIFVLRTDHKVIGMVNLLFTISTAEGGLVLIMEDLIIHPQHRNQGYGGRLLGRAIEFAKEKRFKRITLLTDRISADSQSFFQQHGFQFSKMIPMRLVFKDA